MRMSMTRRTYSLSEDLARRVASAATKEGKPSSAVVREALQRYFAGSTAPELPDWVGMIDDARAGSERTPLDEQIVDVVLEAVTEKSGPKKRSRRR